MIDNKMMGLDEITIKEVNPSDFEGLKRLLEQNNTPETVRQFHPFPLTAETARWITFISKKDRYYIAKFRNRVIGLCMLRGWDEGYFAPSFGLLIDSKFRRGKVGSKMTRHAIKEARKLGCKKIRLSLYYSNIFAYRLYTSLGFIENMRSTVKFGNEIDEKIIMIKYL